MIGYDHEEVIFREGLGDRFDKAVEFSEESGDELVLLLGEMGVCAVEVVPEGVLEKVGLLELEDHNIPRVSAH